MPLTNRQIGLVLLLDQVGIKAPHTYDERRMAQAAMCIFQLAGVDAGYRFGWYVYGPYSPDLHEDLTKIWPPKPGETPKPRNE